MPRVGINETALLAVNGYLKTIAGRKVYVYETGTTTPITIYDAQSGGSTVTQPLEANDVGVVTGYWASEPTTVDFVASSGEVLREGVELVAGIDQTDVPTKSGDETVTGAWDMRTLAVGDSGDPGDYPSARFRVYSNETNYSGARYVGSEHEHYAAPSSAPSAAIDYHGIDAFIASSGSHMNSNVGLYPAEFQAIHGTTGTISRAVGVYGYAQNTSTGTINSDATAFQARVNNGSTGTINNGNDFWARLPLNPSGGTISIYAAFRSDDHASMPSGVTDAYHLFLPGGKSYITGKFGFGISAPLAPIHLGSDAANNTSGILFGSAADLSLYRSGSGILSTNGAFIASGSLITSGGYFQTAGGAGSNRAIFGYANGANAAGFALGSSLDVWAKRGSGTTITSNAAWSTTRTTAPADADLAAGEVCFYFDSTNGAAKLKIKGKSANGTVVAGEVALA